MIGIVTVIGGGAWGTALALVAARAGREVRLYARDPATVESINRERRNPRHLPDIALDPAILATGDLDAAASEADLHVLAVPAQAVREAAAELAPFVAPDGPVLIAAKGIERGTGSRMTEIASEVIPHGVPAVLSGPSFAADVARGLPTAVTVAAGSRDLSLELVRAFAGPMFRPYAETDIVGVELGGALKNVLAIAAGIVAGRGLGASAGAALVARGFAEMRRFAEAFGARPETLMGLSGLGDLVLTCGAPQSRNYGLGVALGAGRPRPPALAEGVATAEIAREMARARGIEMPVTDAVAEVIAGTLGIDAAAERLMARPLRQEAG